MGWQNGRYPRMLRHIAKINALEIEVGIVKPKTHTSKGRSVSMAALYAWHDQDGEADTGNIRLPPKRRTLRPAIQQFNHKSTARKIIQGAVTGKYKDDFREAGEIMAKAVRQEIMKIKSPALKPSTIRQRTNGGSNPLVDTGQLLRAIGSKVE